MKDWYFPGQNKQEKEQQKFEDFKREVGFDSLAKVFVNKQ